MQLVQRAVVSALALWNKPLAQEKTNGASTLGLLTHTPLAKWVAGPTPQGTPWGLDTVVNANPYKQAPYTGQVRTYYWEVSNVTLAPDGVEIPMLVVNGAFPGPLVEANWGDEIIIHLTNNLKTEGTALHMHGFLQTGTPYMDGVPGTTQCPIAPGQTYTYKFRAELYGTSWWHSHLSAQYISGMSGPVVIHGPVSHQYDIDVGPVMLTDWFHDYYHTLVAQIFFASPFGAIKPPASSNILINGKSNFDCNRTTLACTPGAGLSQFRFTKGKRHLLRLINHGAEAILYFSIDGYNLTVIAQDFVPVKPYVTNRVILGVGQRSDIVVRGKGKATDAVWMRVTSGPSGETANGTPAPEGQAGCALNDGIGNVTLAAVYYNKATASIPPNTTTSIPITDYLFPGACANDPIEDTVPAYTIPVTTPDVVLPINVVAGYNSTGAFHWYMNNVTLQQDFNDPTLLDAKLGADNVTFPSQRLVYNYPNAKSIRVILTAANFPTMHPMHLHGHNFQVLSSGPGPWDGTIVNPQNPARRDTHMMAPFSHLVVQWDLDNPGLWPFHCHIAWHISEGMGINVLDDIVSLKKNVQFPQSSAQLCRQWAKWSKVNVDTLIDSGL